MFLLAVLLLGAGTGGCLYAAVHWSGRRELSPLFENSMVVALVGLLLTIGAAAVEALRQVLHLAQLLGGWLNLP